MNDHIGEANEMSDTPISDSTAHNVAELGMLCRKLERELNTANDMFRKLNIHALNLTDRIKRLEDSYAAKDAQLSNLLHICRDNDIEVSSYDLIHGKEAKP